MGKVVIFRCIIACFLILVPPSANAIRYDVAKSSVENKVETSSVSVYVHGG